MKNILRTIFYSPRGKLLAVSLLVMATPAVVFGYNQISSQDQPEQTVRVQSQTNTDPAEPSAPAEQPNDENATITDSPAKTVITHPDATKVSLERLSGQNAIDTSVAVSKKYYKPGVSVAYIAERSAFADAIVAGSMKTAGPILYVNSSSLTNSVTAELKRLKPKKVIIVGGSDVVSNKVRNAIIAAIPSNSKVERLSGTSRYDTAVDVSRSQYPSGANTVYITNGMAYPDAIAATQQSAAGPLLYTRPDSVPGSVIKEIKRLKPSKVVVVGSSGVVSEKAFKTIDSNTSAKVIRIGGKNRYETATGLSRSLYPKGIDQVYIVNGNAYADAILVSSIPKSGAMLYVSDNGIPQTTSIELNRLGANKVTIIGGPIRVSEASAKQLKKLVRGSALQSKLSTGISYFLLAHPDDEIAAWSLIQSSEYPVFILLTRGENSARCVDNGGRGSDKCKARRISSFHNFLNNYYSVSDKGNQAGGYRLHVGKDSARLIFDLGDGNLTQSEVVYALNKARAVNYGKYTENYISSGNYWDNKAAPGCDVKKRGAKMCGLYDHPDHRSVKLAIDNYKYPNRINIHGSYNPDVNAATYMGQKTFDKMMACPNGTYNKAYGWLNPPCWTEKNSLWRSWHYVKDY